jgi:hypothetical protein
MTAWRAQVDTVGDTVVVHTLAGSAWGDVELVPEMRIGAVEGADYEIFGQLTGLAVDTAGAIYVYDTQVPALRKYAADGSYAGTFGRKGGGPGEYAGSDGGLGGLAVLRDGRVVLRDPGNGRFTVYALDGEYLTEVRARGSYTSVPIVPASDGGFYNPVWERGATSFLMSIVRYAPDGTPGDTLPAPERRVEQATVSAATEGASQTWGVPFSPSSQWTFHPDGYYLSFVTDRYAIDLLRSDQYVLRLSKQAEPVPVSGEERDAQEQRVTAAMRRLVPSWRWNGPPIPNTKPIVHYLYVGDDGRIWVQLYQPGERIPDAELEPGPDGAAPLPQFRERAVFDVFDTDGRYLGTVSAPERFRTSPRPVFRGDYVWATESDTLGVEYVVRYHIARDERR